MSLCLSVTLKVVVFLYSLAGFCLIYCTGPRRAVLHCFSKGLAEGKSWMEQQCRCMMNRDIQYILRHRVSLGLVSARALPEHGDFSIFCISFKGLFCTWPKWSSLRVALKQPHQEAALQAGAAVISQPPSGSLLILWHGGAQADHFTCLPLPRDHFS